MKIGILTFHRSYNYGAFIQCFSLIQRLKRDFPNLDVEVIDYSTASSRRGYDLKLKRMRKQDGEKLLKIYKLFDESQELYLPLSKHRMISDDYKTCFNEIDGKYDIVIVGSDAVWNWIAKPFPNAYFLGEDISAIKMSYAASAHGQYYKNMTEGQRAFLNKSVSSFRYIGTRESTTEDMLRYCHIENPIYRNCDPSILLDLDSLPVDMNDLEKKLIDSGADFSRPIIGLMAGGYYGKKIKEYFGNKVQIIAIYEPNRYADVFLSNLNPLEWARVFSFFNVTVTHFFHGTMISLKNLTPVIAVETKTTYHAQYISKLRYALMDMELEMFYSVFDRGSLSIFNRAMYKFGLKTGDEFWHAICNQMEELIDNPRKQRIAYALEKQEKLYDSFKNCLKDTINCWKAI
jgi:hypothetical protein